MDQNSNLPSQTDGRKKPKPATRKKKPKTGTGKKSQEPTANQPLEEWTIRCICGYTHDDGFTVQCEKCSVWQHVACVETDGIPLPEEYICEQCDPRQLDSVKARDVQTMWLERQVRRESTPDIDYVPMESEEDKEEWQEVKKPMRRTTSTTFKEFHDVLPDHEPILEFDNRPKAKKRRISSHVSHFFNQAPPSVPTLPPNDLYQAHVTNYTSIPEPDPPVYVGANAVNDNAYFAGDKGTLSAAHDIVKEYQDQRLEQGIKQDKLFIGWNGNGGLQVTPDDLTLRDNVDVVLSGEAHEIWSLPPHVMLVAPTCVTVRPIIDTTDDVWSDDDKVPKDDTEEEEDKVPSSPKKKGKKRRAPTPEPEHQEDHSRFGLFASDDIPAGRMLCQVKGIVLPRPRKPAKKTKHELQVIRPFNFPHPTLPLFVDATNYSDDFSRFVRWGCQEPGKEAVTPCYSKAQPNKQEPLKPNAVLKTVVVDTHASRMDSHQKLRYDKHGNIRLDMLDVDVDEVEAAERLRLVIVSNRDIVTGEEIVLAMPNYALASGNWCGFPCTCGNHGSWGEQCAPAFDQKKKQTGKSSGWLCRVKDAEEGRTDRLPKKKSLVKKKKMVSDSSEEEKVKEVKEVVKEIKEEKFDPFETTVEEVKPEPVKEPTPPPPKEPTPPPPKEPTPPPVIKKMSLKDYMAKRGSQMSISIDTDGTPQTTPLSALTSPNLPYLGVDGTVSPSTISPTKEPFGLGIMTNRPTSPMDLRPTSPSMETPSSRSPVDRPRSKSPSYKGSLGLSRPTYRPDARPDYRNRPGPPGSSYREPGYPPREPGYHPGYPPREPGYPPREPGYPPREPGYPPRDYRPPPPRPPVDRRNDQRRQ